ncbi:hypothetical protein CC79DRAFT_188450 [Sarocladium strictum]
MTFPQFASLPEELQLQVWEACKSSPAMHIFDVCSPPTKQPHETTESHGDDREPSKHVSAKTGDGLGVTVFLDALCTTDDESEDPRPTSYAFDPSMYHFDKSLRRVTKSSESAVQFLSRKSDKTLVHLPRRQQTLEIARSDVMMLRFRKRKEAGVAAARTVFRDDEDASSTTLGEALEGQWSPEMAKTLRSATKVALDLTEPWIAELGGELAYEEIAFLACTLQHDLEVLYLVDNCVGRCAACGNVDLRARHLQKKGVLWECLNYQDEDAVDRPGDVVEAVSKKYLEVADFERLGWTDTHPYFVFARMIDEMIRGQQHGESKGKFKGVRILVAEDEVVDGIDSEMHVRCQGAKNKESALDLAMGLLPILGGVWNE